METVYKDDLNDEMILQGKSPDGVLENIVHVKFDFHEEVTATEKDELMVLVGSAVTVWARINGMGN